jgi:hypothetical protein
MHAVLLNAGDMKPETVRTEIDSGEHHSVVGDVPMGTLRQR